MLNSLGSYNDSHKYYWLTVTVFLVALGSERPEAESSHWVKSGESLLYHIRYGRPRADAYKQRTLSRGATEGIQHHEYPPIPILC